MLRLAGGSQTTRLRYTNCQRHLEVHSRHCDHVRAGQEYGAQVSASSGTVEHAPSAAPSSLQARSVQRANQAVAHRGSLLQLRGDVAPLVGKGLHGKLECAASAFVHPLRPPAGGHYPVVRYETEPGKQVQFDWGEFKYEQDGVSRKLYGFTAILCYSRMRFVTFVKRCDAPTMIRCLMEAFEYFGGLPKAALTDRMKSVLLEMEDKVPRWNALFADFMASIGVAPRVCKAFTPQTKGKIERTVGVVKQSFWAGVCFTDVDDLNRQAHAWCERINARVHRTTHERPRERREREPLSPLPAAFAWERFATEERKVSWDGYLSYDGVLYGLPSSPPVAGSVVQVRERHGLLSVWSGGQLLVELAKRAGSGEHVEHPDQFRTVAPAASRRAQVVPIGHLRPAPQVMTRALAEYDQACGIGAAMEVR